jgi:hypothetical protein
VLPSVFPSHIHFPAPLGSAGITRFRRYYGCSDSCRAGCSGLRRCFAPAGPVASRRPGLFLGVAEPPTTLVPETARRIPAGLPCSRDEPCSPSVSNHLLPSRSAHLERAAPSRRHQGFASHSQARQDSRPNRVRKRYGRGVHLGLLSTSPHEDAVTFGFRAPDQPWQGLPPCGFVSLQGARVRRASPRLFLRFAGFSASGSTLLPVIVSQTPNKSGGEAPPHSTPNEPNEPKRR